MGRNWLRLEATTQSEFTKLDTMENPRISMIVRRAIWALWLQYVEMALRRKQSLTNVQNGYFISGSEDGTVSLYSLVDMTFDKFLVRSTLPVRDVALSSDGVWCAVASDELTVKLVKVADTTTVVSLSEQSKPVKHISFSPKNDYLTLSCTDGVVYVYALGNDKPELVRRIDGLIQSLDNESEVSAEVIWHPDGRAFAAPTATHDVQVISASDWEFQRVFADGHMGNVTALSWSPNGALLATAGKDRKILLWDTKTQNVISRYDYANVMDISWHPSQNLMAFTNTEGEVFIYNDFVPEEHVHLLSLAQQPAPFFHDPLREISNNVRKPTVNGAVKEVPLRAVRRGSPDSLDDLLGLDREDEDDFVIDDDGAGYAIPGAVNGNGKRTHGQGELANELGSNKRLQWTPEYHEAFQPGATPWRGNRKYLCLNFIGFVWTVDQDTHHTVTVEFYDRELYRDFHFTDTFRYDKACLNERGTLFSCPSNAETGNAATIFYRPHETWTERQDWRTQLPQGEEVTSISLSDSFITVTTSANYVRIYTLYLTPYRVYRQKSSPTVSCASWRDYVLTLGNGPVGADGTTKLLYTIENIKRDEICQSEDVVALADGTTVKNVFFSDNGDPCIYDSAGVLLVLLHWRTPSQARWVPLLDTTQLSRLASGRKTETYWPVAVADGRFHCIILKGGDKYPYFPRPLLSEFEFQIPIGGSGRKPDVDVMDEDEDTRDEQEKLEESYVRKMIDAALTADLVENTNSSHSERTELARRELEVDKTLLQMLAKECREGEERGMKALELVELMRDSSGRMMEAAVKVAERYERSVLSEKIREIGERRLAGMDDL